MSKDSETRHQKSMLIQEHVFLHLKNLNNGFDSPSISYFSPAEFEIVLSRIKELGFGITGIEPWKDGDFYDVATFERTGKVPEDPHWYMSAFEKFQKMDDNLQYSASYSIPIGHPLLKKYS